MNVCNKKGQLAIFVIVAIVIMVGLLFYYFVIRESAGSEVESLKDLKLYENVEDCITNDLVSGVKMVGLQGGYLVVPSSSVMLNSSKVAYGYYSGSNVLVSKEKLAEEISRYIEMSLEFCINEDDYLDYVIKEGVASADVSVDDEFVSVVVNFPFFISDEEGSLSYDKEYKVRVPMRIGAMHKVAKEIIVKESERSDWVSLSYLSTLDYNVTVMPYSDKILIYELINSDINDKYAPYVFRFAFEVK